MVFRYIKVVSVCLVASSCAMTAVAQPYTAANGHTRHRFAQLNIGVDTRVFLSSGSEMPDAATTGLAATRALGNQTEARLMIGGTHFWGHADFYLGIPLASFGKTGFGTGVETGMKVFPWKIAHHRVVPYAGLSMLPVSFQQGEGTTMQRFRYPVLGGLVYNSGSHLLEVGGGFNYQNSLTYYTTPAEAVMVKTQPFWLSLGYKYMLETTVGAEKDWQSGRTKALTDTLAKLKRLNGLTLAVGPSAAFFLKSSTHNSLVAPYSDQHKSSGVFPEFALGYYHHRYDVQAGFVFRSVGSSVNAFHFSQKVLRRAYTIEVVKFVADYHGFVPFVGPALSYEQLSVNETNQTVETTGKFGGVKPGVTFGWDIRPNRLQAFYLRTNLRYFLNMNVAMATGRNVSFDQLEFNFIQLVVFPGRFR